MTGRDDERLLVVGLHRVLSTFTAHSLFDWNSFLTPWESCHRYEEHFDHDLGTSATAMMATGEQAHVCIAGPSQNVRPVPCDQSSPHGPAKLASGKVETHDNPISARTFADTTGSFPPRHPLLPEQTHFSSTGRARGVQECSNFVFHLNFSISCRFQEVAGDGGAALTASSSFARNRIFPISCGSVV